jgi:hypothetical protein
MTARRQRHVEPTTLLLLPSRQFLPEENGFAELAKP